jgi:UDP-N-acetylmuramate: L-alanyl-gamma-D-glutamyl-meso-diaminopimelate ligase
VSRGFSAGHLEPRPDLVVIGNAVRPDNPEARAAIDGGLAVQSFPDALYEHAMRGRHAIVVTGTHGKTTTTSLIATLLQEAGRDPSLLVGGLAANFDGSFQDGAGPDFVVEGDEYDTAFFDKTPKFLHYHAETLVITSIEFDHADIYRDLTHIQGEFRKLLRAMPAEGWADARCRVIRYGVDCPADRVARDLEVEAAGTHFTLEAEGRPLARISAPIFGRFNVENALAAIAVLEARGVPAAEAAAGLQNYRGVKRRQEVRGEVAGVTVVDDFAHHPTAVRGTLRALRERYPGRRLVAAFEPRSNTSRRALFQQDYAAAFDAADRLLIQRVPDAPIYSATGEVTERLSAETLAADVSARGVPATAHDQVEQMVDTLCAELRPGDVVVTLSNGSFGDIWGLLLERMPAAD